jgi:hypothetical protein
MSITGLFGSAGLLSSILQGTQSNAQKLKQEFQQLGQDLQADNLSAAQADFATLQQNSPFGSTATSSASATAGATAATGSTGSTVAKEFQQLGTDLQAGNLSAAQSDFSTIQQTFQNAAQGFRHGHHHHHGGANDSSDNGGGTTATGNSTNPIGQALISLGQALQAGNLNLAQSAYATLQQDFEQFAQGNGINGATGASGTSSSTSGGSAGVSVSA